MGRCNVCTCPARLVRSLGGSDFHRDQARILTSRTMKDVNLRYVVDSGVRETTQGVHPMSGYIDVGKNMSMVGSRFSMQKVKTDFTLVQW
jgi:hypothetical protein